MPTPTMDDHRRDAVRYPACNCGAVWRQRGNVTGHCTKCHETFEGITLFDRHQHISADGRTICTDPADITLGKAETHLEFIDGVWRGPRMPESVVRERFGPRAPTPESSSQPRQTPEQPPTGQPGVPTDPMPADDRTAITGRTPE